MKEFSELDDEGTFSELKYDKLIDTMYRKREPHRFKTKERRIARGIEWYSDRD